MSRRHPVQFDEPVDDLTELGERLQQSLGLTVDRLHSIKSPALLRRALHVVDHAQYMFSTLSQVVQTTHNVTNFLMQSLGVSTDDLFKLTGDSEYAMRVTARQTMMLVNEGIKRCLNELSDLNVSIDKEQQNGEKKT